MTPIKAWRLLRNGKILIPFQKTRSDCLAQLYDGYDISLETVRKLEELHHTTAGWAYIEYVGWRIEPIIPKKELCHV